MIGTPSAGEGRSLGFQTVEDRLSVHVGDSGPVNETISTSGFYLMREDLVHFGTKSPAVRIAFDPHIILFAEASSEQRCAQPEVVAFGDNEQPADSRAGHGVIRGRRLGVSHPKTLEVVELARHPVLADQQRVKIRCPLGRPPHRAAAPTSWRRADAGRIR